MQCLLLFALIGIVLTPFSEAVASEPGVAWHVRPDGSDASCNGLVNAPDPGTGTVPRACAFRTPQKAVNAAGGGDTVLLHAGTYSTAGTPVQRITNIIGISLRTDLVSENTRLTIKSAGDSLGEFRPSAGSGVDVGGSPVAIVAGEFNLDGKPDLAVVNASSNNVTILLGVGAGSFSPAAGSPKAVGASPSAIATADFDHDGIADLAVANSVANNVTILLGDGGGGFTAATGSPVSVGLAPSSIAAGDFNRDSRPDLAVVNRSSSTVTILIGDGSGGFAAAAGSPVAVGSGPRSAAVGDFNQDDNPDLAVANSSSGTVSILLGNGAGGFTSAAGQPASVGTTPRSVAVGDFNLDGTSDLAVANSGSDTVTILLGDGAGAFAQASTLTAPAGSRPWSIVVDDFSLDGKPDLAVANSGSGDVTILLGDGTGKFSPAAGSPVSSGTNPQSIAVADFDLDGKPDLAVPNAGIDNLTVLLGFGNVVFDGGDTISTGVTIWGTCFVTIEGVIFRRFTASTSLTFPFGAAAVNIGSPGPGHPSSFNILRSLAVTASSLENVTGRHAEIAIWCPYCVNNRIEDCQIESTQPVGIAVGQDGVVPVDQGGQILGNWITHSRDNQAWIGVYANRTNIWTMDGNYLTEGTLPNSSTDLVQVNDSTKWTITNNVFYRPPNAAINLVDSATSGGISEQDRILNNTIECTDAIGTGIRCARLTGSQVRNNILDGCAYAVSLVGPCANTSLGFNEFFDIPSGRYYDITAGLGSGFVLVGSDVFADPVFQAVTPRPDPYYRLQDSSPAIDAGDDQWCGIVPVDAGCDIGAYQATSTAGNDPPYRPSITLVNQLTGRSAVLHGSSFDDVDIDDVQGASQWQVDLASGNFSTRVYDSGRTTTNLLSIQATGLDPVTAYKARVRYQDAGGLWSPWSDPAGAAAHFTTLAATAVPPKVTSVDPAAGAKNVSVSIAPVLVFNVPLETASVSTSTVNLKRGEKLVPQAPGSPALCTCGEIVTLTATGLLDPNTVYSIAVKGGTAGVQSRDGSIPGKPFTSKFTTETALASSDPVNGETGVLTSIAPTLTFKWAIDPSRVNDTTFSIRDVTVGRLISLSSVTLSPDGTTVTLTPTVALKKLHQYRIRVLSGAGGLMFTDGRKLGTDIKVGFKTSAT